MSKIEKKNIGSSEICIRVCLGMSASIASLSVEMLALHSAFDVNNVRNDGDDGDGVFPLPSMRKCLSMEPDLIGRKAHNLN